MAVHHTLVSLQALQGLLGAVGGPGPAASQSCNICPLQQRQGGRGSGRGSDLPRSEEGGRGAGGTAPLPACLCPMYGPLMHACTGPPFVRLTDDAARMPPVKWREHSFLDNPRCPEAVKRSKLTVYTSVVSPSAN